ncbi:MAG: methyltransferase domain-containing protein, partial [Planctomycetota bacterium]|nr:methyltransferase domain-containing protein [Planctomycetota bacterium]
MRAILPLLLCCCTTPSNNPGINSVFLEADDATILEFVERFEGESREISALRNEILDALEIQPGDVIADIGAGTGLFEPLFHNAVGADGTVYAVDIAPKMVEYLQHRVDEELLSTVEVIQCTQTSAKLPASSCDIIFICDTYHHFEYPNKSMQDIYRSLKPGGKLCVVDFVRIEGQSRDWILNHVRCGQETVVEEIVNNGFHYLGQCEATGLKENYMI